jgi:hypothetical protein
MKQQFFDDTSDSSKGCAKYKNRPTKHHCNEASEKRNHDGRFKKLTSNQIKKTAKNISKKED